MELNFVLWIGLCKQFYESKIGVVNKHERFLRTLYEAFTSWKKPWALGLYISFTAHFLYIQADVPSVVNTHTFVSSGSERSISQYRLDIRRRK